MKVIQTYYTYGISEEPLRTLHTCMSSAPQRHQRPVMREPRLRMVALLRDARKSVKTYVNGVNRRCVFAYSRVRLCVCLSATEGVHKHMYRLKTRVMYAHAQCILERVRVHIEAPPASIHSDGFWREGNKLAMCDNWRWCCCTLSLRTVAVN